MNKTYSVLIIDMFHYQDSEHEYAIEGFPTLALAKEFARRWVRDSLEELREPGQTKDRLRDLWFMFGEDALVVGEHYAGSSELDFFINNPASSEERDWKSVKKEAGIDQRYP
jgi:hypothetical protein